MPEAPNEKPIRVSVDLPAGLHMGFRLHCIQHGTTMKEEMLKMVLSFMQTKEKPHNP